MTGKIQDDPASAPLIDRADVRVKHEAGAAGAIRAFLNRVRSGDLGSLPVVIGLVIIWTVFETLNPVFLSSDNLVNLLFDSSTVGVISLGIVCILIVGEIDLSVGSVSGFASAMVGVLWVNQGWPVWLAILAALVVGGAFGGIYALLFNRVGMPSFISSLAGLLAVLGLQLYVLGSTGSINLPYGSALVTFGQTLVMPHPVAYALAALPGVVTFDRGLQGHRTPACSQSVCAVARGAGASRRRRHGRARAGDRLPQHVARRALDVRPVRRPRRSDELRSDADEMGALDDGGRRES